MNVTEVSSASGTSLAGGSRWGDDDLAVRSVTNQSEPCSDFSKVLNEKVRSV